MNPALIRWMFGILILLTCLSFPTKTFAQPDRVGDIGTFVTMAIYRPMPRDLKSVAFGNNLFVAIGPGLTILTSKDGKVWVNHSSGVKNVTADINFASETYEAGGDAITFATADISQRPTFPDSSEINAIRDDTSDAERSALIKLHQKK